MLRETIAPTPHAPARPPHAFGAWAALAAGLAALAFAVLVYASRTTRQAPLLEPWRAGWLGGCFGAAAGWLPSALHVFGFALITAACGPRCWRTARQATLLWLAVNVLFECGQHTLLRARLAGALAGMPSLGGRALGAYFEHGTFDVADLLAALAGAAAAAACLRFALGYGEVA